MRVEIFVCIFILFVNWGCTTASHITKSKNSSLLKKYLGSAYQVHLLANGIEARYCPDNTCDVIKGPSGLNEEVISDFAFLYLSRHSTYTVIKDFQNHVSDESVAETMTKYKFVCADELPTTKCVLAGMANYYSLLLIITQ